MGQKPIGKVVKILNPYEVVINLGAEDGVTKDDEFVVFEQGEEVTDPDTDESLGILEIVRGQGVAKHVQEKLTTLRSTERTVWGDADPGPLDEVEIGHLARKV